MSAIYHVVTPSPVRFQSRYTGTQTSCKLLALYQVVRQSCVRHQLQSCHSGLQTKRSYLASTSVTLFWASKVVSCQNRVMLLGQVLMFLSHISRPRGLAFTWCVAIYVFWHKPTELAHSFLFCFASVSVFMVLSTVFHSMNSPDDSAFSLCFFGLNSAFLVLSTI